jgi:curli biogenesis system outer membrane secretion channel CsgG
MKPLALTALAVTLSACSTQSTQPTVLNVANPAAMSSNRPYTSVVGETKNLKPVEPGSWTDANAAVGPGGAGE